MLTCTEFYYYAGLQKSRKSAVLPHPAHHYDAQRFFLMFLQLFLSNHIIMPLLNAFLRFYDHDDASAAHFQQFRYYHTDHTNGFFLSIFYNFFIQYRTFFKQIFPPFLRLLYAPFLSEQCMSHC